jgi:hypothetical protein
MASGRNPCALAHSVTGKPSRKNHCLTSFRVLGLFEARDALMALWTNLLVFGTLGLFLQFVNYL